MTTANFWSSMRTESQVIALDLRIIFSVIEHSKAKLLHIINSKVSTFACVKFYPIQGPDKTVTNQKPITLADYWPNASMYSISKIESRMLMLCFFIVNFSSNIWKKDVQCYPDVVAKSSNIRIKTM